MIMGSWDDVCCLCFGSQDFAALLQFLYRGAHAYRPLLLQALRFCHNLVETEFMGLGFSTSCPAPSPRDEEGQAG